MTAVSTMKANGPSAVSPRGVLVKLRSTVGFSGVLALLVQGSALSILIALQMETHLLET